MVGTPSGITLAPEGGAHQSIGTPLIGMAQDGLATFEPAYVDELAVIMEWAFDYMQREGPRTRSERWHRDEKGGSVYLRLSTRPLDQPLRPMTRELRQEIIDGGYWLRRPEPGTRARHRLHRRGRARGDRGGGPAGRGSARRRRAGGDLGRSAVGRLARGPAGARAGATAMRARTSRTLLSALPRDAAIVTVTDAYPEALSWLGGVCGHRVRALGVEHFGQSGSISELYGHYGLDVNAILAAAEGISGRPVRYRFQ